MKSEIHSVAFLSFIISLIGFGSQQDVLAQVQLHPSFKTRPLNEEFSGHLIGTAAKPWIPSMPTMLLYTGHDTVIHLSVQAHILPGMKLQLAIHHQCSAKLNMDAESLTKVNMDINALNSAALLCQNLLPIEIKVTHYLKEARSAKIDLQVKQNNASKVAIDEVLIHYALVKVELFGTSWSIISNGLYLRSWDPKFITEKAGPLVTTEAKDLLTSLSQSLPIPISFIKVPFIETKAVDLIKNAPEFIQSTISIGAFATFNSKSCEQEPSMSIAFMSRQYLMLYKYSSTMAFRIRALTGRIHYSRHGLSKVAQTVISHAMNKGPSLCQLPKRFCTVFKVCSRLENSHISWKMPFNTMDELLNVNISNHAFLAAPEGSEKGRGQCQVEEMLDKRIKVFTNTRSQVLCPIICSKPGEPYAFFQGSKKLLHLGEGEYTRYGAVSVHRSGMLIRFDSSATYADSGEYSCTAGGQFVRLHLDIVSLPLFSIPGQANLIRGRMQEKIYPLQNDGYAVNCTVFYSDMSSVTLTPVFYVARLIGNQAWTEMSLEEFKKHAKSHGSNCKVTLTSTSFSTMLILKVSRVPEQTKDFDFSHRFVCSASVSDEDNKRFGLSDYAVQSGTDILVPPIPTDSDIWTNVSVCCLKKCPNGGDCTVDYTINSDLLKYVKDMGLEVRGSARTSRNWIPDEQIEYDGETGNLRVRMSTSFGQFTKEEWTNLETLTPVYSYHDRSNYFGFSKVSISRYSNSRLMGAAKCHVDISCIYSTDLDLSLANSAEMSLGGNLNATSKSVKDVKSILETVDKAAFADVGSTTAALFLLMFFTISFLLPL